MGSLAVLVTFLFCVSSAFAHARIQAATAGEASQAPPRSSAKTSGPSRDQDAASDPGLAQAKLLVEKGLLRQAEETTRQYLQQHADSAEGHFLLGYVLFDEIHDRYAAEEEKEGPSFRYNDSVGASLASLRDQKARESLAEFSDGARYGPASGFDLKIVALDYLLLQNQPSAEKWLAASVKLNPQDAQAWFYLGRTAYSETKYANAIEAFEHCLKLDPKNVVAEYNVGLAFEGLNQRDQAIQAYQNAIAWQEQSNIKSPEPFIDLARLHLEQNEPQKAVPYLTQAVRTFPQISLAHEELGRAYSVLKRLPEAQQELEQAVKLSPDKASLRCLMGQVYQREKMAAKAQTEFDRCATLQNAKSSGAAHLK